MFAVRTPEVSTRPQHYKTSNGGKATLGVFNRQFIRIIFTYPWADCYYAQLNESTQFNLVQKKRISDTSITQHHEMCR